MEKQNPFTLALSKINPILSDTGEVCDRPDNFNNPVNINISDITTFLIQNVGRYCDRYASDLLITHESLINTINNLNPDRKTEYLWLGLRESGVDGIAYIIANIKDHSPEYIAEYYRKVFCIRISFVFMSRFTVKLYDMSNDIYSIACKVKETNFTLEDYDASIGNKTDNSHGQAYGFSPLIYNEFECGGLLSKYDIDIPENIDIDDETEFIKWLDEYIPDEND